MSQSTPGHASAHASGNDTTLKARRFVPEPVETTSRSSKTVGRHLPERAEATKVRRFGPEPIETSSIPSRNHGEDKNEKKPTMRRFAPEPMEISQKSSRDTRTNKPASGNVRFKPELVETTYGSNRKSGRQSSRSSVETGSTFGEDDTRSRKFDPVVLSTAKRSRRAGDSNAASYQDYKTEEGRIVHARELQEHAGWKPSDDVCSGSSKRASDHDVSSQSHQRPSERRRVLSPLDGQPGPRSSALNPTRSHSFRCPDLDTIESSESDRESTPSSMSCSPRQGSPITASDSSFNDLYRHATRARESVDEGFSHYLLQLEAEKAQQKLLQDQALAAFANSDFHEPVHHYVNDDQDSSVSEIEDRPVTWEAFDEEEAIMKNTHRRDSTKVPWEQLEMQRHAERLEEERNANRVTAAKKEDEPSPWWNPIVDVGTNRAGNEMRSMRDRARPPMLGNDLLFPRCPSPEPARFDVTQHCSKIREQVCGQHASTQKSNPGGLWASKGLKPDEKVILTASTSSNTSTTGKGLWGGFCVGKADNDGGLVPPSGPTGLMTPAPRNDNSNPFEQSFTTRAGGLVTLAPPTPPESINGVDPALVNAMLTSERDFDDMFEREYPNSFITQVFNYLSLGYPSLAQPFDEELSKISRIHISELRQDDVRAKKSPRGYIRLGPDFEGGGGDGREPDTCVRWHALKLYIREWAKQEKNMVRIDDPGGNWATTNRRGSWAW